MVVQSAWVGKLGHTVSPGPVRLQLHPARSGSRGGGGGDAAAPAAAATTRSTLAPTGPQSSLIAIMMWSKGRCGNG